jgi:hypothetical protein
LTGKLSNFLGIFFNPDFGKDLEHGFTVCAKPRGGADDALHSHQTLLESVVCFDGVAKCWVAADMF